MSKRADGKTQSAGTGGSPLSWIRSEAAFESVDAGGSGSGRASHMHTNVLTQLASVPSQARPLSAGATESSITTTTTSNPRRHPHLGRNVHATSCSNHSKSILISPRVQKYHRMASEFNEARKPSPPASDTPRSDRRHSTPEVADVITINRSASYTSSNEAPLPYDGAPPLPDEPLPQQEDDGWEPLWDFGAGCYYFKNRKTGRSQWENPRVPEATANTYGPYDRFANYHQLLFSFLA
jgi:hypothetical protein